ncbi:MAG: class I tRNA ligase family protein, partial [Cellulomonas sp.]|nr:class I tRNA ligase family protein [Cellulomonas sp.]
WSFKQLYDQGLAYSGYRVLPYCWRDQTPLSAHELNMDDDVYQDRQDRTLTVTFPFVGALAEAKGLVGVRALAWTTTPWTLPTNQALAVGPDIEYVVVPAGPDGTRTGDGLFLLGADRLGAHAKDLGYGSPEAAEAAVTRTVRGEDLADLRYTPLFEYYTDTTRWGTEDAWRVLVTDFVTTEDGTGIVHLAPAYGEVDKEACDAAGLPTLLSVDDGGVFTDVVVDFAGRQVFDANKLIIDRLRAEGRALRDATYVHSYPHCWRCGNPLIYKAVSSWFVAVTKFRDRMVELNQQIEWTPDHLKDGQFGKWLAGARDWSISRNRYWGTPIPVWVSDDPAFPRTEVYGSFAELEEAFGALPRNAQGEPDLHRPWIDELTRPNPDDPTGRATMRRIPDILDVWFDSGSMPYAQVHYPHQNRDWFEHHYPGDFIVEYIGQTRGWFYTLHVLATALFDRPAFRSCVSHGIVLGNDGRKASKKLRNYPDPMEMFDTYGSDAVRWALMSSAVLRGGNLVVAEENIREGVRQVLLPLWSTYYFFTLYANAAGLDPDEGGYRAKPVTADRVPAMAPMDRYLLARTGDLAAEVAVALDVYDVARACALVREHMDLLTNWYVRTQRDRFWGEDDDAFDTLWTALEALTRVVAPLAPLVAEEVWRGLTGERSVHLTDFPTPDNTPGLIAAPALTGVIDQVRQAVSVVLSLRKAHQIRVRQPLSTLVVALADPAAAADYADLLATELNVKTVDLVPADAATTARYGVAQRLSVNARAAGPRLGRAVQAVIKAAKAGDWTASDDAVVVTTPDGPVPLEDGEYELTTVVAGGADQAAAVLPGGGFVVLDLALDDALRAEGYARDVVRAVQDARKAARLDVSDRIDLVLTVPDDHVADVRTHQAFVGAETLAVSLDIVPGAAGTALGVTVVKA